MMICTVLIRVHFLLHCEQVSHEGMCQTLKLHTSKLDSSCEHLWKYMLRKGGKVIMWGWCSTQLGIVGPGRAGGPWGEHPLHPLASSCADLNTHQSTFSIRVMNFGWIFWKVTIANLPWRDIQPFQGESESGSESISHSVISDCSPPGSFVHGILQGGILNGLPFPSPGDLPDPGIELTTLVLQSRFFTVWVCN